MHTRSFLALTALALMLGVATTAYAAGLIPITSVSVGGPAHGVAIQGNFAYVARDNGMAILDISSPSAPLLTGAVATNSDYESQGVAVQGSYAYLAATPFRSRASTRSWARITRPAPSAGS